MRPRGSITGPIVIIALGVIFLLHAISPEFPLLDWLAQYWPYLLIVWGGVALAEVLWRTARGAVIPTNGVSGGAWFVVVLVCLLGMASFEVRKPDTWWRNTDWSREFDSALGNQEQHAYSVNVTQQKVGKAPHIVLENFRGDAKIIGSNTAMVTVGGHKMVRSGRDDAADKADAATPVDVVLEGNNVIIRCNQGGAPSRTQVTTDLDLSVPGDASIEVEGVAGDLEISAVKGDLALRSGNAGIRVQDIGGSVRIETRRSDLVRCTNVTGAVELKGHGSDVELSKVAGAVTINGDYTGTVSLRELSKPVRVQNSRTDLELAAIPGEVRLDRGSLNVQNALGPLRLSAHSTDVTLEDVTSALDISVDRGDVELKPGKLPLGKIAVHAGAGNIELSLPQAATFALNATTDHGQVENDFGEGLKEETSGRGSRLQGTVGSGPSVDLSTGRGSITVRKTESNATTVASAEH